MNFAEISEQFFKAKNIAIETFNSITSTNEIAKNYEGGADLKIFVANHQTQGRGRGSNTWVDTESTQLLISFALKLNSSPQHTTAPRVGLSLFLAAKKAWPQLAWSLKAPNDLLLNGKKIAGLLIESQSQGDQFKLVVGLGFNLLGHPEEFDEATHLNSEHGLSGQLAADHILEFLAHFHAEITNADFSHSKLSERQRETLLTALNANPNKSDTFIEVTESCDLVCDGKTYSWKDL